MLLLLGILLPWLFLASLLEAFPSLHLGRNHHHHRHSRRQSRLLLRATTRQVIPEQCDEFMQLLKNYGWDGEDATELARDVETGRRGVYAKQAFETGDIMCVLPFSGTIVVEDEETTDAKRGFYFLQWQKQQQQQQQHDASEKWRPYLELLPTRNDQFDPTPDFWTDEEIATLELPELTEEVLERKQAIEAFASASGNDIDLEDLKFASWLVRSRAFSILCEEDPDSSPKDATDDDDDEDDNLQVKCVLIPYLDMLNHSSDSPNAQLQVVEEVGVEGSSYALQATRSISIGEEITISYGTGKDESIDLFMNYGFVPTLNPYDVEAFEDDGFEWSTTLKQDQAERKATATTDPSIRNTLLALRIKLKRAMQGEP
jgi:hypothetical protein